LSAHRGDARLGGARALGRTRRRGRTHGLRRRARPHPRRPRPTGHQERVTDAPAPVSRRVPAMDQRLSLVTLGVRDVARAGDFYEAVGFERRHDLGDIVFLPTTGPVLALYGWDELAADAEVPAEGSGFRGVTLAVNLDSRAHVDGAFATWLAAGAATVRAPVAKEWGGYSGYLA